MAEKTGFLKEYETIRLILRDMLFYGSLDEIRVRTKFGIKRTKFYDCQQFIMQILGKNIVSIRSNSRKTFKHFYFLETNGVENYLMDIFYLYSFTSNQIAFSIQILDAMYQKETGKAFTQQEIMANLVDGDERTIQRILKRLCEFGLLKKKKKNCYYAVDCLLFNDKTNRNSYDLIKLYQAAQFFQHILHPLVCGNYMVRSLQSYLRNVPMFPYKIKHAHYGQILDEEVLWTLLKAIHQKYFILFMYNMTHKYKQVQPYRIIVDEDSGRCYLFAIVVHEKGTIPKMFRLDLITNLKVYKPEKYLFVEAKTIEKIYQDTISYSFNGIDTPKSKKQQKFEMITLHFSEEAVSEIQRKFPDTKQELIGDHMFSITVFVNKTVSLKPWLREYAAQIHLVSSTDNILAEMHQERKEWLALYGIDE